MYREMFIVPKIFQMYHIVRGPPNCTKNGTIVLCWQHRRELKVSVLTMPFDYTKPDPISMAIGGVLEFLSSGYIPKEVA